MSENNQTTESNQIAKTGWSSVQVYTLSLVCLIVGVTVGYLFRGSTSPKAADASISSTAQPGTGGAGALPPSASPDSVTPDALKRMTDKQVAPLLEQLKQNPNDVETLTKVAAYYFAGRQFEDSAKYYEMAANAKPSAEALTKLANAQYYGGSGDKAIETLNKALQLDPKFANALYNLGVIKWELKGDTKGAIASWETLLKTNPKHPGRAQVEKMIARAKEHDKLPAGKKGDKTPM